MAKLLTEKPTNLTEYPNSFERQGAFPLDANSIFWKLETAQEYAKTNGLAYVGQIITVIDNNRATAYLILNENGDLQQLNDITAVWEGW